MQERYVLHAWLLIFLSPALRRRVLGLCNFNAVSNGCRREYISLGFARYRAPTRLFGQIEGIRMKKNWTYYILFHSLEWSKRGDFQLFHDEYNAFYFALLLCCSRVAFFMANKGYMKSFVTILGVHAAGYPDRARAFSGLILTSHSSNKYATQVLVCSSVFLIIN